MVQKQQSGKKGHGCLKGCLFAIAIPILVLGSIIFFATLQLRRSDADILKTYQPTAEIADIVEKNTLTDKGKVTFYRAEPQLVDSQSFMQYCRTAAGGVEALACTAPKPGGGPFGGRQIFLLKIDDPKFADHKYAAAVHEMLHVAYSRLNLNEKRRVNTLLDQELTKHQNDLHLISVINTLKKKSSTNNEAILNELHSKFGVEYSNLSPELEDYYKLYFTDREKVVAIFKNGGFNSRVRKMDEIAYEAGVLNAKLTTMNNQISTYKNTGDIDSYNRLIPQFNSLVSRYNAKAAESKKIYSEIQQFYQYFNPDYQLPTEKTK